jgi:two-component system response regulator DesR
MKGESAPVRILLADDQHSVRSALRLLLQHEPGLQVVGEAANAAELSKKLAATSPDQILLDWSLRGLTTSMVSEVRQEHPHCRIIVLSGRPEARSEALAAGADCFVSKTEPPELLLAAINQEKPRCQN